MRAPLLRLTHLFLDSFAKGSGFVIGVAVAIALAKRLAH